MAVETGQPDRDPSRPEQPGESAQTESRSDAAKRAEGSQIEHKPRVVDPIGTLVGRRYEITEFVGAGRRGKVYLARDRLTEATVALKRFRMDTPTLKQAAERAMAAAEIVAGLRHDHIVRVFDLGEDPAGPYVISEYIDGLDAARLVASQGAMSLRQAAKIVETIGQAVSFAHERGLYHGSIRGSNILFTEGMRPMLCDFSVGEVEPSEVARARRQDVKSLVRTLCQLLTGVSTGSVEVRKLPEAIQPAVRASLGTGVTTGQPTIDSFLRELRATELDLSAPQEDEFDALGRGRKAELSGSFDAMREAGESALEKNGESAEAMVLLRRADQLKAERNELTETFRACEQRYDYAGALDALTKLLRRFPADHQSQKLGPKRETLAELTRLTGIADQLVSAGHVSASVDSWKRIAQLSPGDERAKEMVRVASRARIRKQLITATGAAVVVLAVGGAGGYFAWQNGFFGASPVVPGLSDERVESASANTDDAAGEESESRALPAQRNPLIADGGASDRERPSIPEERAAPANRDGRSSDINSPVYDAAKEREREISRAAAMAKRDALNARRHAEQVGAPGLAPAVFEEAAGALASAEALLIEKSYADAADGFDRARLGFVSAAARAGGALSEIRGMIEARRFRDAGEAIVGIESVAKPSMIEMLRRELSSARGSLITISENEAMPLRYVEPGVFVMGSPDDEDGRRFGEDQRQVRIEQGFWIAQTELTRGQLAAIRGGPVPNNPGLPAVRITLDEARTIAELMSDRFGGTFSVPTEEQWEYACRADREEVYDRGWSVLDSGGLPKTPGQLAENPWGIVDMIGNVAELVIAEKAGHGEDVVMTRGGSYLSTPSALRAAARHELVQRERPDERVGLRLVWTGVESE
ncbi:MAG: hypothetical protein ED559_00810 [Phycisphaera sp.]|nr:MAG: hypothetical protein ED559_00810 [Phycisphaera sp.]